MPIFPEKGKQFSKNSEFGTLIILYVCCLIDGNNDLSIILNVVSAFGYIALDNLGRLQGNNPSLPAFESLARKELIIDMEKNSNRFKLLKYIYQNARL
jgi:hypothetical protein